MNRREKKVFIKKSNVLDLTPFRLLEHEKYNEFINVLLPRFNSKFPGAFFQSLLASDRKFIKIKLDEFGSETWNSIDGNTSVKQIITALRQKFGEKIEPAEERTGKFISMLYEQRYISFTELKD